MHLLVRILAIIGFTAVFVRLARALARVLYGGVSTYVTRELGQTRARRGDLTGMQEAESQRAVLLRERRAALALLALLAGMMLLPLLTPWPAMLYACYSALWLVPHRRARP